MKKTLISALLLTLCVTGSALADTTFADVNYSPKSGDTLESLGIGVYQLTDKGSGLYLNGTLAINPSGYNQYNSGGTPTERAQAPYLINFGMTFPVMPSDSDMPIYKSIHSYFGVGYGMLEGRAKYPFSDWGNDATNDKSGFNANGGFILAFENFGINIGVNSYTKTFYAGIGVKLPAK